MLIKNNKNNNTSIEIINRYSNFNIFNVTMATSLKIYQSEY